MRVCFEQKNKRIYIFSKYTQIFIAGIFLVASCLGMNHTDPKIIRQRRLIQQNQICLTISVALVAVSSLLVLESMPKGKTATEGLLDEGFYGYNKPWHPKLLADDGQGVCLHSPFDSVIDLAVDKPIVFGQHLKEHGFHMRGFGQSRFPGSDEYRQILGPGDVTVTFNSGFPSCIQFRDIKEAVNSAENNANIVTDAAVFLEDKFQNLRLNPSLRCRSNRTYTYFGFDGDEAIGSVFVPTKYGEYDCRYLAFHSVLCCNQDASRLK